MAFLSEEQVYQEFMKEVNKFPRHEDAADFFGVNRSYITMVVQRYRPVPVKIANKLGYLRVYAYKRMI